jgi:hypothetical protein
MATLNTPQLKIVSAQPGFSTITVWYLINFDDKDRAVNQQYDERIDIIGVDEPAPNSHIGLLHWPVRPDMVGFLKIPLGRVHEWTVPNWSLDEDKGSALDQIRADVTLVPLAPSVGPVKSNVVEMQA